MRKLSKKELRAEFLKRRTALNGKQDKSTEIFKKIISFKPFLDCDTVLCYYSVGGEVSTRSIIEYALYNNKTVGIPVCVNNKGNMRFYKYTLNTALKNNRIGIPEPEILSEEIRETDKTVVIVPALSFAENGFRLGYGGGYYDRYLEDFKGVSVGLCYDGLISESLPYEDYDKSVDFIITEKEIINCKTEE